MDAKDLLKPAALVLGIGAAGALGFAAGFIVARDPAAFRRVARAVAGGVERVSLAVAESREELADLWAEVREDARQDIEAKAFAAAAAGAATSAAAAAAPAQPEAPAPAAPRRRATRGKATARRAAPASG
jgi:hypothetical protein